jgi:hypothetical protein
MNDLLTDTQAVLVETFRLFEPNRGIFLAAQRQGGKPSFFRAENKKFPCAVVASENDRRENDSILSVSSKSPAFRVPGSSGGRRNADGLVQTVPFAKKKVSTASVSPKLALTKSAAPSPSKSPPSVSLKFADTRQSRSL